MATDPGARLTALRQELARQGVDGFIVPRADEHLGEYVPAAAERLAWLTGFTGSAGLAAVLADVAAVFTDGRYVLQLEAQTPSPPWQRRHLVEEPPHEWLAAHAGRNAQIGYDPWLISEDALARFTEAGLTLVALARNPIDVIWTDRPAPPLAAAVPHPLTLAGRAAADKREDIAAVLRAAGQDAAVITDPASLAWLLNIRGADVPFTPFALGFALVSADAACDLFMAPEKLPDATRAWLGNAVAVQDRAALPAALRGLAGKRVRVDSAGAPAWFAQTLRAAGAEPVAAPDPCLLPKAAKNEAEQDGARAAHARDSVALARFLHWLSEVGATGSETEISVADRLLALRAGLDQFRGESFPAISGAGEHGAIIHYRVSTETNRHLRANEVFLIDSGAQFADGTTDVTRTVWTGPDPAPPALREQVTLVLKGHIAVASLVFPQGLCGQQVDAFARRALWQVGLDYDHGTGHGVGSFLSVHEGPVSLSRTAKAIPLAPGMVLSNEPGFYLPGNYGIRLENLLMVQKADFPNARKPFLRFETLTLAPFDRALIETALLTSEEIRWLDEYHFRVLTEVGPKLDHSSKSWLQTACVPLR